MPGVLRRRGVELGRTRKQAGRDRRSAASEPAPPSRRRLRAPPAFAPSSLLICSILCSTSSRFLRLVPEEPQVVFVELERAPVVVREPMGLRRVVEQRTVGLEREGLLVLARGLGVMTEPVGAKPRL